jgi:hypothetical protein
MATYVTEEIVFDLPDGFVDESNTMLSSAKAGHPISIVVTREPLTRSVEDHVKGAVQAIQKTAPVTRVLGHREREIGHLPGREVRFSTVASKQPLYIRQAYVPYYDKLLAITFSSLRTQQPFCDSIAEKLVDGIQFRKR